MATKKPTPKRMIARTSQDATAMLRADHKKVSDLFSQYESARSVTRKQALVEQICSELKVHTQLEEEIFYPAVQSALKKDRELIPEANVEHGSVKELIAQVEGKTPDGDMFDAKIKVMSEWVKHHVKEEQNEMFPKAKKTKLDMNALGAQMAERKAQLLGSQG
jgi:hemerythrin superfamily protein